MAAAQRCAHPTQDGRPHQTGIYTTHVIGLQRRHQQQWLVSLRTKEDFRQQPMQSTPSPAERCQLMGVPPSAVSARVGTSAETTKASNSLVGNGFHIPCIMALLSCIPQLLAYKVPPPWTPAGEVNLRERVSGTVWEPGVMDNFPDLITPTQAIAQVRTVFQDLGIHDIVWVTSYHVFKLAVSLDSSSTVLGCANMDVNGQHWVQRLLHPKRGLRSFRVSLDSDFQRTHPKDLITFCPGLGKESHMRSRELPSPFQPKVWPERR